jgi:hypothetical protein
MRLGTTKVAGAFGRTFDEEGRFHFDKFLSARYLRVSMARLLRKMRFCCTALRRKVEVAVFHAEVVAAVGVVFDGEGRRFGGIEHVSKRFTSYFDVAGRRGWGFCWCVREQALRSADHEFAAQFAGLFARARHRLPY